MKEGGGSSPRYLLYGWDGGGGISKDCVTWMIFGDDLGQVIYTIF